MNTTTAGRPGKSGRSKNGWPGTTLSTPVATLSGVSEYAASIRTAALSRRCTKNDGIHGR
jgi:hypothetical protein